MIPPRPWPLRLRLALVAALLTLLGLAVGLAAVYWSLLRLSLAGLDAEGRLIGRLVLESAVTREDQSVRIPRVVESYLTDESGASAAQAYVDGELVWEGGVIDAPRPLDPELLLQGQGAQSVDEWRVYTLRDEDAGIVVQVGRPLLGVREVLGPFDDVAPPLTLVLALLSGAIAWGMVGVALRPLRELSEAAERFEEEGAGVPALPGRDEPARLARAFAALLARLGEERARERRFLAYAAHELRTPISALRAGLETAQAGGTPPGPDLLARLLRESIRLELLARNLLALTRAETGEAALEPIDLEEVVGDAYDRFQPLALERGLGLEIATRPVPVQGDPRLLAQAIDNLASNALRFTSRGGIALACGREGARAYIEVSDTGPGLRQPVREGLGLRVVRAVARAHAGEIEWMPGEGATARLWIAAAPAAAGARAVEG